MPPGSNSSLAAVRSTNSRTSMKWPFEITGHYIGWGSQDFGKRLPTPPHEAPGNSSPAGPRPRLFRRSRPPETEVFKARIAANLARREYADTFVAFPKLQRVLVKDIQGGLISRGAIRGGELSHTNKVAVRPYNVRTKVWHSGPPPPCATLTD
jgi:hypothetical protein